MGSKIRLILDEARSATLNMAIDEWLMDIQIRQRMPPSIRIYFWDKPSISVGYFQDVTTAATGLGCSQERIDVVKRLTGGGTVFHGSDLTFSITLGTSSSLWMADAKTSYLKVNEALRTGLRGIYPDLEFADCRTVPSGRAGTGRICFEKPSCYDLMLGARKVVGASQRRKNGAALYQATVFLEADKKLLTEKILESFKRQWDVCFETQPLSPEELSQARRIERQRYALTEWACPPIVAS